MSKTGTSHRIRSQVGLTSRLPHICSCTNLHFPTGHDSYCGALTSQTSQYPAGAALQEATHSLLAYANKTATPNATTLYYPLLNFFSYVRTQKAFCGGQDMAICLGLTSPSPYDWLICTEYGQFATGYIPGTKNHPHALPMVSRTLTPKYYLENCHLTYNITYDPVLSRYNKYGGFNLSYPRLAISTGQLDWYRAFGPLAEFLEDGTPNPRVKGNGTVDAPQIIIKGGYHEWDFGGLLPNETDYKMPAAVKDAQSKEVQTVKLWLREWNQTHGLPVLS